MPHPNIPTLSEFFFKQENRIHTLEILTNQCITASGISALIEEAFSPNSSRETIQNIDSKVKRIASNQLIPLADSYILLAINAFVCHLWLGTQPNSPVAFNPIREIASSLLIGFSIPEKVKKLQALMSCKKNTLADKERSIINDLLLTTKHLIIGDFKDALERQLMQRYKQCMKKYNQAFLAEAITAAKAMLPENTASLNTMCDHKKKEWVLKIREKFNGKFSAKFNSKIAEKLPFIIKEAISGKERDSTSKAVHLLLGIKRKHSNDRPRTNDKKRAAQESIFSKQSVRSPVSVTADLKR